MPSGVAFIALSMVLTIVTSRESLPCEIEATLKCSMKNLDLIEAILKRDNNTICLAYGNYRDCLLTEKCPDKNFIDDSLKRTCQHLCDGCATTGDFSAGADNTL